MQAIRERAEAILREFKGDTYAFGSDGFMKGYGKEIMKP